MIFGRLRDDAGNVVCMKVSGQTSSGAACENHFVGFVQTFGHQRIEDSIENWESLEVESDSIVHHWFVPVRIIKNHIEDFP